MIALQRIKAIQFDEDEDTDEHEEHEPQGWLESEDPKWREFLDQDAVEHFARAFDHSGEQGRIYTAIWGLTPFSRRNDPIFNTPGPWPFDSVIDSIYQGEYRLLGFVRPSPETAEFRYDPLAGPFGGTECLVQLIEAFGQWVTLDSWHRGPHHRPEVGWDYERAQRLVEAGRGVD